MAFDEFVAFLFDHDVDHGIPPESEKYDPWYFHADAEFDAKNIGAYYVRMFRQPEFLLKRFTKAQLEEGFWATAESCRMFYDGARPPGSTSITSALLRF
jgi:hypothetical protein